MLTQPDLRQGERLRDSRGAVRRAGCGKSDRDRPDLPEEFPAPTGSRAFLAFPLLDIPGFERIHVLSFP
jgi:hypothetical protein